MGRPSSLVFLGLVLLTSSTLVAADCPVTGDSSYNCIDAKYSCIQGAFCNRQNNNVWNCEATQTGNGANAGVAGTCSPPATPATPATPDSGTTSTTTTTTTTTTATAGPLEPCAGVYDASDDSYKSTGQDKCPNGYSCFIESFVETPVDGVSYSGTCIEDVCSKPGNDAVAPKVTICHRTCSNHNNPWVRITVDRSAWESGQCKHGDHLVADCNEDDTSGWGSAPGDYLLTEHDPQVWANDHLYRKAWQSACPSVQNGKCCVGADCCTGEAPTVTEAGTTTTTPYCPPDVGVYEAGYSVEWDGASGSPPVSMVSRNGQSVTFAVSNVWGTNMDTIYTQFEQRHEDGSVAEACPHLVGVGTGTESQTFTAQCSVHAKTAIVFVYVSDPDFDPTVDAASVPACCHPDSSDAAGKRKLTIVLQCEDPCPSQGVSARYLRGR